MKLHNKMMLTLLLMYKIPQMFLISLRTITSMTLAKRLSVVLWTYELIKKKPTFEDIEDEEEDDTKGNYDSN